MPLHPGSSNKIIGQNIKEFHTGKTYRHTKAKFGTERARKQAIAVALHTAREYGKKYGGRAKRKHFAEGGADDEDESKAWGALPSPNGVPRITIPAPVDLGDRPVPKQQGVPVVPSVQPPAPMAPQPTTAIAKPGQTIPGQNLYQDVSVPTKPVQALADVAGVGDVSRLGQMTPDEQMMAATSAMFMIPMPGEGMAAREALPAAKAAAKFFDLDPNIVKNFAKVGKQEGSNPGGWYEDLTSGDRYYIKTPQSLEHAKNEKLAAELYKAAGVPTPEIYLTQLNGKLAIASKEVEGQLWKNYDPAWQTSTTNLQEHFPVDAWLANWDVIGLNNDNILIDNNNTAHRIDMGGALRYRAQGALKNPGAFGPEVTELQTMADPNKNTSSANVFGGMMPEDMQDSAKRIAGITDEKINELVSVYGPQKFSDAANLAQTLMARRDSVVNQILPKDSPENIAGQIADLLIQKHGYGDGWQPYGDYLQTLPMNSAKQVQEQLLEKSFGYLNPSGKVQPVKGAPNIHDDPLAPWRGPDATEEWAPDPDDLNFYQSGDNAHKEPYEDIPEPTVDPHTHPQKNDSGEQVHINKPSNPTHEESWFDTSSHDYGGATAVPGWTANLPYKLNDVPFRSTTLPDLKGIPAMQASGLIDPALQTFEKQQSIPLFKPAPGKSTGAGVIIMEPDGRVWITHPTNQFGGYNATFPKGTVSGSGIIPAAIREAFEETGLKVQLHDWLGDYEGDTSKARYYIGRRVGGTPADMGWESQAVTLIQPEALKAAGILNKPRDQKILDDLIAKYNKPEPPPQTPNQQILANIKAQNAAKIWGGQGYLDKIKAGDLSKFQAKAAAKNLWENAATPLHAAAELWHVADELNPHTAEQLFRSLPEDAQEHIGKNLELLRKLTGSSPFDKLNDVEGKYLVTHTDTYKATEPSHYLDTQKLFYKNVQSVLKDMMPNVSNYGAFENAHDYVGKKLMELYGKGQDVKPTPVSPKDSNDKDAFVASKIVPIPHWPSYKPEHVLPEPIKDFPNITHTNDPKGWLQQNNWNINIPLYKGGHEVPPGSYPDYLKDPSKHYTHEPGLFTADHPVIAGKYGPLGGKYIGKADKAAELNWKDVSSSGTYQPGTMARAIKAARSQGYDLLVVHHIDDIGSRDPDYFTDTGTNHQTQYIFLHTKGTLRSPEAKFAPEKLHEPLPLAGIAATAGAAAYEKNQDSRRKGGRIGTMSKADQATQTLRRYGPGGAPSAPGIKPKLNEFSQRFYRSSIGHPPGGGMPGVGNIKTPHVGMIHSSIPGRTDKINMGVKGGSYILPADVVSGVGQGNSMAGSAIINKMFSMGPYGSADKALPTPKVNYGRAAQSSLRMPRLNLRSTPGIMSAGGVHDGAHNTVPIVAAGGETVIPPEVVLRIGHGNMKHGHEILDHMVLHVRKKLIQDLKKLPGPKKR